MGQGGTLDPLASGVLVIGVGTGTKALQGFLDCAKTYETVGLLGASTTSYDSQDPIMLRKPHSHVTSDMITSFLPYFTGPLLQYPPLFSAVKMDGKRLMDYARQNLPLPRPIDPREIEVVRLELQNWHDAGQHSWKWPEKEIPEEDKKLIGRVKELAGQKEGETETVYNKGEEAEKATKEAEAAAHATEGQSEVAADPAVSEDQAVAATAAAEDAAASKSVDPAAFRLRMTVSSGTYVRSIVHDVGLACSSAAHVVELRRTRQGEWVTTDDKNDDESAAAPIEGDQTMEEGAAVDAGQGDASTSEAKTQGEASAEAPAATGGLDLELRDDFLMGAEEPTTTAVPETAAASSSNSAPVAASEETPREGTALCLPWSLFADAHAEQQRVLANVKDVNSVKLRGEDGTELKQWEKELLRVLRPV